MRISFFIFVVFVSCSVPKASFEIVYNNEVVPTKVSFINTSKNADHFKWFLGGKDTSELFNPTLQVLNSGRYNFLLQAKKGNKVSYAKQSLYFYAPEDCLVKINTTLGEMIFKLNDETPIHRENFLKLIESNYYNNILFHRVIKGFIVQAGDPESINAKPEKKLGGGGPSYTLLSEIQNGMYHTKGVLAAARMGDEFNPKKESSGSQFYIVQGRQQDDNMIELYENQKQIKYPQNIKNIYKSIGGAPQLDKEYTIFGQIIEGMDVVDKIANVATDTFDRPVQDVKIINIQLIR